MRNINEAFDSLNEQKLIFAGSVIPAQKIAEAFEINLDDRDFIFKKLSLKGHIELQCFFVTDRGCEEDCAMRILSVEEMAEFAENKLIKNKQSNEKIALILKGADLSKLSKEEKFKHDVAQKRAANCASAMGTELLRKIVL